MKFIKSKNQYSAMANLLEKYNSSQNIKAIILKSSINRLWYTGFQSSAGIVVITNTKSYLLIDGRYYHSVTDEDANLRNIHEVILANDYNVVLYNLLKNEGVDRVGFEADHVTYDEGYKLNSLSTSVSPSDKSNSDISFSPINTTKIRLIKSTSELKKIKKAYSMTDEVFNHLYKIIKPGMSEKEIARIIQNKFMELGADDLSFPSIVAAGNNSAFPHHKTSNYVIQKGDILTIDIGCIAEGYCSDMTRTLFVGEPKNNKLKEIYEIVKSAQRLGITMVKKGAPLSEIHSKVYNYIRGEGYAEYFNHGTGHGIGIEIHEDPYLIFSNTSETVDYNIPFTVEPGIYIPGVGGVRIEDGVYYSDDDKVVVFGTITKDLLVIDNS